MRKLLILTGPQGSGNHLWTHIFSDNPQVAGWDELVENYWAPHRSEKFSALWKFPDRFYAINQSEWTEELYVTSISCPTGRDVNKNAREHFEIRIHKRILDIYPSDSNTRKSLVTVNLPSGVKSTIK